MRVICAGAPKTGTKSTARALRILGYGPVYDSPEAIEFGMNEWEEVLVHGESDLKEVFDNVYSKVDAVVDFPHSYFFDEFFERWPNSKVILLLREEDAWYKSFKKMTDRARGDYGSVVWLRFFSPALNRMITFYENMLRGVMGHMRPHELLWKKWYRRHNTYVRSVIPKEQLLEYCVSEGWKPLCDFLGKPVPNEPYPHENKVTAKHNIADKMMQDTKLAKQAKKEIIFLLFAFPTLLVLFLAYLFYF